jgi:hypothetical protein
MIWEEFERLRKNLKELSLKGMERNPRTWEEFERLGKSSKVLKGTLRT